MPADWPKLFGLIHAAHVLRFVEVENEALHPVPTPCLEIPTPHLWW